MMKKGVLSMLMVFALSQVSLAQEHVTTTFGVRGNCGMCKMTIEKAAKLKGVSKADWNVEKKEITVTYNPEKTELTAIHKSIAKAGYDTDKTSKKQSAYDNLHGCCKYDPEMIMGGQEKKK